MSTLSSDRVSRGAAQPECGWLSHGLWALKTVQCLSLSREGRSYSTEMVCCFKQSIRSEQVCAGENSIREARGQVSYPHSGDSLGGGANPENEKGREL